MAGLILDPEQFYEGYRTLRYAADCVEDFANQHIFDTNQGADLLHEIVQLINEQEMLIPGMMHPEEFRSWTGMTGRDMYSLAEGMRSMSDRLYFIGQREEEILQMIHKSLTGAPSLTFINSTNYIGGQISNVATFIEKVISKGSKNAQVVEKVNKYTGPFSIFLSMLDATAKGQSGRDILATGIGGGVALLPYVDYVTAVAGIGSFIAYIDSEVEHHRANATKGSANENAMAKNLDNVSNDLDPSKSLTRIGNVIEDIGVPFAEGTLLTGDVSGGLWNVGVGMLDGQINSQQLWGDSKATISDFGNMAIAAPKLIVDELITSQVNHLTDLANSTQQMPLPSPIKSFITGVSSRGADDLTRFGNWVTGLRFPGGDSN